MNIFEQVRRNVVRTRIRNDLIQLRSIVFDLCFPHTTFRRLSFHAKNVELPFAQNPKIIFESADVSAATATDGRQLQSARGACPQKQQTRCAAH